MPTCAVQEMGFLSDSSCNYTIFTFKPCCLFKSPLVKLLCRLQQKVVGEAPSPGRCVYVSL